LKGKGDNATKKEREKKLEENTYLWHCSSVVKFYPIYIEVLESNGR